MRCIIDRKAHDGMSIVRRSEDLRRRCPVSYRDYELCLLPIYLVPRSQCYACLARGY